MHTLRLLLSLSRHFMASSFFSLFHLPPSFSSPPPSPNYLTCYPPSPSPWHGLACMRRAGAARLPSPSPGWQGSRPSAPWGAGRPRDAGAGAERGPRGLRASSGAGWWGLCYNNYVCAPCRGGTPPSPLFPGCSWVAAVVFIYCFFSEAVAAYWGK